MKKFEVSTVPRNIELRASVIMAEEAPTIGITSEAAARLSAENKVTSALKKAAPAIREIVAMRGERKDTF